MTVKTARRRPWLAGLLQVILPGLGSVYVGRPVRGLVLFVVYRSVSFSSIPLLLRLPSRLGLVAIVLTSLLITVLLAVDGVRGAKAENPHYKLAPYNRWYVYILVFICIGTIDAFFITNFTRSYLFQAMQPSTPSMEPSVLMGITFSSTRPLTGFPSRGAAISLLTGLRLFRKK